MKKIITICLALFFTMYGFAQDDNRTKIRMQTNMGDIIIALYNETPIHSENFKKLVKEGVYDSLLFHRVICNFMIQGGDPDSKNAKQGDLLGNGDLGYSLEAEFRTPELFHKKGAVAMAREGDATNPERRSSACQFYIVTGSFFTNSMLDQVQERLDQQTNGQIKLTDDMRQTYKDIGGTPFLDGQYTVFGEVIQGLDIIDEIQKVATDQNDRPLNDVRIIKAEVIE